MQRKRRTALFATSESYPKHAPFPGGSFHIEVMRKEDTLEIRSVGSRKRLQNMGSYSFINGWPAHCACLGGRGQSPADCDRVPGNRKRFPVALALLLAYGVVYQSRNPL